MSPIGGLEFFDLKGTSEAQVIVDQDAFTEAFNKATLNILSDLDWTGVLVAGECLLVRPLATSLLFHG